jgi:hypothetical protein
VNATQLLGIVSFGIAGFLCLSLWRPPWTALGFVNLFFSFECFIGWRHLLHDAGVAAMGSQHAERVPLQVFLMSGSLIITIVGSGMFLLANGDIRARVAVMGTGLSASLFLVETISLHDIDELLYHQMGPSLLIGWVWLALAICTGLAAILSHLRHRATPQTSGCL